MSQKTIKESIQHWKRMLKWAKKQPSRAYISSLRMRDEIWETWFSDDCPLCREYKMECNQCKLGDCDNPKSCWGKVYNSRTWGIWCKNAELMIKRLEGLLKPTTQRKT